MTTLNEITQYLKFAYPDEHFNVFDTEIIGRNIDIYDLSEYFSFEKKGLCFAFTEIHHMIANLRQAGEIPEWWSCDPKSKWYRVPEIGQGILVHGYDFGIKYRVEQYNFRMSASMKWRELPPEPEEGENQ